METQTAGSATAEATNPTMSPFYSRHDTGTASTEALNPNMNPFRTLSDSHDAIRSDAAEPPDYTRRPGNGENLLQTSPLLVSDDSTQQVQIHPSASITTPRYPSFPIEKPPARSKSVQFLGHQPGLKRGIQIPTRMSYVTSGFPLPKALVDAGVDEARWQQFSNEAKSHGAMSGTQWATVCAGGYATFVVSGLFVGFVGLIPGSVVGHKLRKHREQRNFAFAQRSGALGSFSKRWNKDYFEPLGLHVRVEAPNMPGCGKMEDMDVSSTKLFKYQEKKGVSSLTPGMATSRSDKKEQKYQIKEGRYRVKAARKGRIIVVRLEPSAVESSCPTRP